MAAGMTLAAAAGPAYLADVGNWRVGYEEKLKAPGGWLSVAGLFWLHEGENSVGSDPKADIVLREGLPKRAGVFRMKQDSVWFQAEGSAEKLMKPDVPGPADVANIGTVAITVIKRGPKTGVRIKDTEAATRRDFTGCKWFPAASKWLVKAKWVAYKEPRTIGILNLLGMTSQEPAPGYAEFTLAGKQLRLEPITEDDHLFFLFKDQTSGNITYAAGRFLYAAMPKDAVVELDFNKSENPPCAFTAFATCPLPPKQNVLPVPIAAGEKKYGNH
ncbi:MAG: uncharacterized protein QOJ99_1311 [Bryobacterales bacterium]|jgi:uncharacterized protein (DUF1684 family)|nr:uncharacterized protein [Bryobacterales bacterium]